MAGPIAFLVPDPIQSTQLIPGGNTPASGGLLFVYQVGSTTKTNSYTDPSASTARTNPIVLDSGGNIPGNGEVWITSTAKFVLAPSNDTDPPSSPYWSKDNYPGINNITAAQVQALSAQSEWVQGSTATFVGVTGFSVVGDQTALYTTGRRVKATVTGGDRFGIVTSAVLATGSTAVGVTLDSGTLNGGLSVISYGILSTPNGSIPWTITASTGLDFSRGTVTTGSLVVSVLSVNSTAAFQGNVITNLNVLGVISSYAFVPTNTNVPFNGLYLIASSNPAVAANSTTVFNWTDQRVRFAVSSVGFPYGGILSSRDSANLVNLNMANYATVNSTANVLTIGDATNSAYVKFKAGIFPVPPTTSDILSGEWTIWRNTAASTTRFYYNNAGTMTSSAAFT